MMLKKLIDGLFMVFLRNLPNPSAKDKDEVDSACRELKLHSTSVKQQITQTDGRRVEIKTSLHDSQTNNRKDGRSKPSLPQGTRRVEN